MTSRIRIKVGTTEIEFEGSEDYMRTEIPTLVELVSSFISEPEPQADDEESVVLPPSSDASKKALQMTTNNIAAVLDSKTGTDLVLAACAHLCFVKGQDTFSRANILAEMKLATNYYKQTHSKNLSPSLKALVKSAKLLEPSDGTYALNAKEKSRLESILNGH